MRRFVPLLPALLALAGCEAGPRMGALAGQAFAADRPPVLEAPPPDTVPTVTRRVWSGPEADWLVGPSPDGKRVALTDWMTGDMAVLELAAKDTLHLTRNTAPYQPGFGMFPRFSPDGKRVVFNWWNADRPVDWQLRVADADGEGEPRVIEEGVNTFWIQPEDWSPDGKWILAARTMDDAITQIVLVPSDGGNVRVLKSLDWRYPVRMNFSPDGRWIVYDFPPDEDTEQRDVWALAVDGSRETRLVQHPADDFVLGWAPDGGVLFASDRTGTTGAWLLPVSDGRPTGTPELVKPDMFQAVPGAFLADGAYLYGIQTGTRDVYVATLDPEGGRIAGPPVKVTARGIGSTNRAAWSPDGRHLAYLIQQGPNIVGSRRLAIRSLESGDVRELTLSHRLGYVQALNWLPDGSAILVESRDEKGRGSLFRIDVQTGRSEPLVQRPTDVYPRDFEPTPDGATLVINESDVSNEPESESRILLRDLRSGEERVIFRRDAPSDRQIRHVCLSPDGSQIAFLDWRGNDPHGLMIMPLSGGEPREVTTARTNTLRWAPDGRHLLYAQRLDENSIEGTMRLLRVAVDGGDPEEVGVTMEQIQDIRVHAPSRRISFTAGQQQAELWVMENFLPSTRTAAASGR